MKTIKSAGLALVAVLVLGACSTDGASPGWQEPYRARLEADVADFDPTKKDAACSEVSGMSDREMAELFAVLQFGRPDHFDELMAERGENPSRDDFEESRQIAVEVLRGYCS